jgi:3-(3-hydroxy-phenyl)propionate hydroxylase
MLQPAHDVVVVGAGPVGLALSLGLARAGLDVLVLERNSSTAEHSRAPLMWPRTQEILAELGVIDDFVETAIILREIQVRNVDEDQILMETKLSELDKQTDHARILLCPQSETESLLHAAVEDQPTADVLFSAEVTELHQRDGSVIVRYGRHGDEFVTSGSYAIGCDGASSAVRHSLDASFPGRTYRLRAALADVRLDDTGEMPFPRVTRQPTVAIGIRIDQSTWRLIMPFASEGQSIEDDDRIALAVTALFGRRDHRVTWKSDFRLHNRVSDVWADRRIALAGDAAHLSSPVGGRGMNVGIQDAHALTHVLVHALAEGIPAPFSEYESERRQALGGRAFRLVDLLTRMLAAGPRSLLFPTLRLAGLLMRIGPIRRRALWRMAMLDDPSRRD